MSTVPVVTVDPERGRRGCRELVDVHALIVRLAVIASVLAIVLFAVPLAAGAARYYVEAQRSDLEGDAEAAAATISAGLTPGYLPGSVDPIDPDTSTAVYAEDGSRAAGEGPARLEPDVAAALAGRIRQTTGEHRFVVAVPLDDTDRRAGVLRAARPDTGVRERTAATWAVMLALAAAAVFATRVVARRLAMRMAEPLEHLVHDAKRLGEGDFTIRVRPSGIAEIDALGRAQQVTAARLSELVARERAFSAEASHQLRTPLAGLRLQLEDAASRPVDRVAAALRDALTTTDRLHRTVEDLLRLARDARPAVTPVVVAEVVEDVVASHSAVLARGQRVVCDEADLRAAASQAALRQILAVLLENAETHGVGIVTVTIRRAGDAVAVDVADDGQVGGPESSLFARRSPASTGHGIGLALARRLAEADGGRLRLRSAAPTTFTLLLPGVPSADGETLPADDWDSSSPL